MWPTGESYGPPQPSRFYQSNNHSSTSNFSDFRNPHPPKNQRPRGKRGRLRAKQSDYSFYSDRESYSDNSVSIVTRTVARGAHRGNPNVFNVALRDLQHQNAQDTNRNNYDRQHQNAQDTNRNNHERQHQNAQDANRNNFERQHLNAQDTNRNNYERQNRSDYRRNGRTEPRTSRDDQSTPALPTKLYVCPKCDNNYSYRSGHNGLVGKVPLILNCNHTVCQECIYKTIINSKVICPVCNKPSTLSQEPPDITQTDLQTLFLPNYYIIGITSCNKPQSGNLNNLDNVKFVSTATTKKHKAPSQPIERCSFDQCSKKATMFCPSCEAIYCIDCCTVIHKSINKLMSHEPVPHKKNKFTLVLDKCKEHKEMNVEFYCKDCDIKACCYCVLDTHTDHEREPLSKLSDLEMIEFTSLKKDAEKVLKDLLLCQKKASNLTSYSTDPVRKEIRNYFADLHAKISSIEKKLHKEAEDFQAAIGNLDPIQASLCQSIDMLKQLVAFDNNACKDVKMNLKDALEKLRDVHNIPRFLLNENGNSDPIRFTVDTSLIDSLDSAFEVEKCENSQYRLVTEDELDEDYVFENDEEVEIELQEVINKPAQLLSEDNSSPTMSRKRSKHGQKYTKPKEKKYNSGMGKITVQHINSMESFFIQYKNDEPKLQQLNSDIENYIKMGGAESVEEFQLNQLYLALYITDYQKDKDEKWCRARLIDIIKVNEKNTYDMFFIDYGKTQVVEANRIKDIPAFLAAKRPFAIQCTLHNPLGVNWSKNSHFALAKILNGKDVCMVVKNVENGIHDVDLMLASSDGSVTSVIDILVHATHSVAPANDDNSSIDESVPSKKGAYFPELKVFPNSTKFVKNQTEKVTIANIVDPYNIFVHLVAYQEAFKSTLKLIKKAYKQSKGQGCIPIEGTYVMVEHKDTVRSNYHRAFIKSADLLNDKVCVQLVDWGVSVVVGSAQIKLLPQNLTRLECQAVLIKLTDIAPYNKQTTWSTAANRLLETYYRSQEVLKMIVHYVTPELEVALFDITRNVDLCLNTMMVENNLADSTGYISTQLEWSPLKPEDAKYSEEDGLLSSLLKKVDCSDKESEDSDNEADNSDVTRIPLDIIKVESPDAIFVKFIQFRERDSNMFKELQIHYSESQEKKDKWKVNDLCVAELEKEFARGKIVEEIDGKYMVSLYDKAIEAMLPGEKLYVYSTYFTKFPPVASKSHLCNVTPAGDTGKWSNSSIESLQEILSKHTRIYGTIIKEHSDCFNKSLPMELWYGVVVSGGPLDADKLKYVSINNILVKLGFAYRKQPKPVNMAKDGEGLLKSLMVPEEKSEKVQSSSDEVQQPVFKDAPNEDVSTKSWVDLVENELGNLDNVQKKQTNQEMQTAFSLQGSEGTIDDWLPPFRLGKKEFEARVTCVETGGHMYLREDRLENVYLKLEDNMKQYFNRNPPTLNSDKWQPGQLCTIKYTDGNWYRGKVLRVKNPREITVIMVDFGSDHDLPPEILFRELLYTDYRCFAVKVKLDKVYSKQPTWLSSDYDHFHELLTDWCKIVVRGPLDVELPLVDVYNANDVYVNQKLVEMCPNLSRCSNFPTELSSTEEESIVIECIEVSEDPVVAEDVLQKVIEEFDFIDYQDDCQNLKYKVQPIPEEMLEGKKLILEIGGILNYDKVALKVPGEDDSPEMYDLAIDIQESVSTMPRLKDFKIGTPCLAQFSEDNVWYRAVISNVDLLDSGFVTVFYVDYGNSESTSIKNLRKIKPDLLNLPQQCWEAFLNIELVDESQVMSVEQVVNSLDRKKRYVKLVKENPVTVDLYDKNDELCYENLKKNGILNSKE